MRSDHTEAHLLTHQMGRREALGLTAKMGAVGALAALGLRAGTAEGRQTEGVGDLSPGSVDEGQDFNDDMFDVAAVKAGAWDDTAYYQKGDQRGTWQEVTPRKTASALHRLELGRTVKTYNLGALMFNGFPAFVTNPPRVYQQRLTVLGYQPDAGFEGVFNGPTGLGSNDLSIHEERFKVPDELVQKGLPYGGTYQIATQLDNLNHIGVGDVFYGGHRGPDIGQTWGTSKLGNEHMGPIVTRGVVIDVLGLKIAEGATDVLSQGGNGRPLLREGYRITVEDIEAALRREKIGQLKPGDVVLFRTGWNQLAEAKDPKGSVPGDPDHSRYLAGEPGIYLREARYLAARRPAMVGGDGWALEVLPGLIEGTAFPVHQELIVHYGIRIGEGMATDALVEDGIYEFVFMINPQYALGATAGNTPPVGLGTPSLLTSPR